MSNLYDKLEVSKNASKEVIDKAYHVLVKKYHPDLQHSVEEKKIAEEKIKEINDAYEILSNSEKRKIYNLKLEQELEQEKRDKEKEKLEILEKMRQQEITFKQNQIYNKYKNANANQKNYQIRYKVKEPWTWKRFFNMIIPIVIIAVIIIGIWIFPPTHKIIVDFYEKNSIIRTLLNIIGGIIKGIGEGTKGFLKSLF